ncbi:PREDICTED: uncharacterized protein LOC106121672 isoform X1 [Papilio xuthus]|uniref:Uncharacterized protein LOC106121672 isoform X1 n=1 Tax=Papilio xuthus TaxID=66420 RepID=A0AAJ6ZI42_PAPXU|nr:PREDICTED: uncharacterized protein LOC106121672 isoform X1 [Papilio xuthus]
MYKTVRHGENSLQYTILPQTEEVLSNSGLKGKGRDYSPSIKVRRTQKGYNLRCVLTVVFVIVGTLSISYLPVYFMHVARENRKNEICSTACREIKTRKKELKFMPEFITTTNDKLETTTQSLVTSPNILTTVIRERATTPPWTMPALRSWKGLTPATTLRPAPTENIEKIPLIGTPSGSVRLLDNYMSVKPWEKDIIIRPTVTPEPMTVRSIFKYYSQFGATSDKPITSNMKGDDVLITTRATSTPSPITTESTTTLPILEDEQSLEIDDVFSLSTLKGDPGISGPIVDSGEVTVSKATGGWYGARWPFVDPSSYFQWTGYSVADNMLLPLLMTAMFSIILVLVLALTLRRRKRTSTASEQIGKLTADLQDDVTNLLQAENPEDPEE